MKCVRVITGPTGSGKTDLALQLGGRIFNADPFQFYKEIPVISNQPKANELSSFQWVSDRSLIDPLTAGEFGRLAEPFLTEEGIWVGTGLYLGAALYGLDSDSKKGTPFQGSPRRPFRMFVIDKPREELYESLNRRVDKMWGQGALSEALRIYERVKDGEISSSNPVLKAIGLRHLLALLRGEVSEEKTLELWKRDTRHLAKRQWTWLRKFCPASSSICWGQNFEDCPF